MTAMGADGRHLPPAIVIGGYMGSAISIARSLGRQGIRVYLVAEPHAPERYSRYVRAVNVRQERGRTVDWADFLLDSASDALHGAVLLACSDSGIEFIIRHRQELSEKYLLDISNTTAQEVFLNKLSTYRMAAEIGIPTPRFWQMGSDERVAARAAEYVYPLIVKPLYSHTFYTVFRRKFFVVKNFDELMKACALVRDYGMEALLLEKIMGPDDRLCSYYTYLDEGGMPLFDYTKRVIRRYPANEGIACYHISDWNPEVRDLALRLLRHAGLLGLANVEFKRDERDGRLKLIECNARFTAANGLLLANGYDLASLVYNRLAGRPQPNLKGKEYKSGVRLWYPGKDFRAFLELRAQGKLDLRSWLRSVLHPQILPYFCWDDPVPAVIASADMVRRSAEYATRHVFRKPNARSDKPESLR